MIIKLYVEIGSFFELMKSTGTLIFRMYLSQPISLYISSTLLYPCILLVMHSSNSSGPSARRAYSITASGINLYRLHGFRCLVTILVCDVSKAIWNCWWLHLGIFYWIYFWGSQHKSKNESSNYIEIKRVRHWYNCLEFTSIRIHACISKNQVGTFWNSHSQ